MSWARIDMEGPEILEDPRLPGMVLVDDPGGWSLYCEHCCLTMRQYASRSDLLEDVAADARKHLFDYHDSSPSNEPRKEHLLRVAQYINRAVEGIGVRH